MRRKFISTMSCMNSPFKAGLISDNFSLICDVITRKFVASTAKPATCNMACNYPSLRKTTIDESECKAKRLNTDTPNTHSRNWAVNWVNSANHREACIRFHVIFICIDLLDSVRHLKQFVVIIVTRWRTISNYFFFYRQKSWTLTVTWVRFASLIVGGKV